MNALATDHVPGSRVRCGPPVRAFLACLVVVLGSVVRGPVAQGQDRQEPDVGPAARGLLGLELIGMPIGATTPVLSAQLGYGITESIGSYSGIHHRVSGQFAAGLPLVAGLSAAVSLDGRFDMHPDDGLGRDVGGVGEPLLLARYGAAIMKDMQLGAELGLRMPGSSAPSVELSATTLELKALGALLSLRPLSLHGLLGFRLDNSRNAAPDRGRLREGDRIALGLSAGNQLLFGLGAHYRFSKETAAFLEWTFDPIMGHGVIMASPMRATVAVRNSLSRNWLLEGKLTASLSRRPEITADAPLVPIEPRMFLSVGLRYLFADEADVPLPVEPDRPEQASELLVSKNTAGPVFGTLTTESDAPFSGARVKIMRGEGSWETTSDAAGHYRFDNIPFGDFTLEASAEGYGTATWSVIHSDENSEPVPAKRMEKEEPTGQLRGLVRSWNSEPLTASVVISDLKGKKVQEARADEEGRFRLELLEGAYRVQVSAPGYKPQKRSVRIHYRGVTILNLDLRTDARVRP